ncbi:hypothetical protein CR513_13577, partial [Mucuna pruriens]
MYKIIVKVLSRRLREVLKKVIDERQYAFIKESLGLGVLIAYEVVHQAQNKKKPCLIFKVDYEEAYDSICQKLLNFFDTKRIEVGDQLQNDQRLAFGLKINFYKSKLVDIQVQGSISEGYELWVKTLENMTRGNRHIHIEQYIVFMEIEAIVLGGRELACVLWDRVCFPTEGGDLCIKNKEMFNESLLGKWKSCMLNEKNSLRSRVLNSKYETLNGLVGE